MCEINRTLQFTGQVPRCPECPSSTVALMKHFKPVLSVCVQYDTDPIESQHLHILYNNQKPMDLRCPMFYYYFIINALQCTNVY